MSRILALEDAVFRGIDYLLRTDYCANPNKQQEHYNSHVDVLEMLESFEVFRWFVRDTVSMIGKPKYQGDEEFNFTKELLEDMKSYYEGENKKYNKLMLFVFEPLINIASELPHEDAIAVYNEAIESCLAFIYENEHDVRADDALVINHVIRKEFEKICKRKRASVHVAAILKLRKKRKKKRAA